jgi:hypothetical protein
LHAVEIEILWVLDISLRNAETRNVIKRHVSFPPVSIPAVECIGEDLEDDLNKTLSVNAGLLFVLDESGSVSRQDYEITKTFVKNIVSQFP